MVYNPEKKDWRGRSYRKGGERVRDLRQAEAVKADAEDVAATEPKHVAATNE